MNCIAMLVRGMETVVSVSDPCSDDDDEDHDDDNDNDDNDNDDTCVIVRPTLCISSTG